jgi:DNA-binding Xre family transcriptional regulator
MLYIDLTLIAQARGINNLYTMFLEEGVSKNCARKLRENNYRTIKLDHMEMICRRLHCTPNDVIKYVPDAKRPVEVNHPLRRLEHNAANTDVLKRLHTMPLDDLQELAKMIKNKTEE